MKAIRYKPGSGAHYAPGTGPYGIQVQRETVRRSWVVVSALDQEQIARAKTWGADVIVLDLEDSIHASRKDAARSAVGDRVRELAAESGAEIFVRPNIDTLYADLEAAIGTGLIGVVLPQVSTVQQVQEAERVVEEMEQRAGLPGVIELHLCLETGAGIYNGREIIAAGPRVRSVSLGRIDLVLDLRAEPNGQLHVMPHLLQRLVVLARAAGVEPVGAWWDAESRGTVAGPDATLRAALRARRHGYRGALCGKGDQVAALNRGFTPTEKEVHRAEAFASAYAQARRRGERWGLLDGEIVDGALAQAAQQVIDFAAQCAMRDARSASKQVPVARP